MAKKNMIDENKKQTPESIVPQNPTDYRTRGWLYHYEKQYEKAEADFRSALQTEPGHLDSLFALGLALKGQGRLDESVRVFNDVLAKSEELEDKIRATMVKRLARGHINDITLGDWNLEKEIWKRK